MKARKFLRIIALMMIAPTIVPFALSCASSQGEDAPASSESISESETQKATSKKKTNSFVPFLLSD